MAAQAQRKINIGGGLSWGRPGWDVLDGQAGVYREPWQHHGKVWNTRLPSGVYDVVYTSHTLEHVPHFKIEQSMAEINRIMRPGGLLRISVPDLEKAARAYLEKDKSYFCNEDTIHPADHLGFGSMFMNQVISPGHQTLAFDSALEPLGSYAHTYNYDFEMLRILLEKWGFGDVVHSAYRESSLEELREPYAIEHAGTRYEVTDPHARTLTKTTRDFRFVGFDNKPAISLYVEARKVREAPYSLKAEFPYNRNARLDVEHAWKLKALALRLASRAVDALHEAYRGLKRLAGQA
ncbi:hypothetical protein NNJEOMEG_02719 [Fundidesulfovibrio magnetotacticus]|uniref:Methyltransferase type 11 domain-containing protein n=1 Tax=Fundidesulfovibrio magnetotacticus TaxID=2730080 RepID=A0A6V8LW90_9BACT|nr:methyltransferase domain-containing protein [Fundidesulfovibrio magnetotacticus]GFK94871.1 hypothetical protein NNJEOMEG_02719 [Fundidesulfovibrio magnetotacticus]